MRALQGERGPFVMVEQGRFPSRSVMTTAASRDSGLHKLQAVDIRVTRFALRRRRLEIDVDKSGLRISRLMATSTLGRFVGTDQGKSGFRMIVAGEFSPRFGGMADLTGERRAIRFQPLHVSVKSPFVWICVTTLASQVLPVVLRGWFWFEIRRLLVAVDARNSHVTSAQTKRKFVVSAQAECRGQKPLQVVALFAAVEVRGGGELPGMFVVVTIRAVTKVQCVDRGFALRNMALCALQRGMLALQRVGGRRVLVQSEGRGLEAVGRVAV